MKKLLCLLKNLFKRVGQVFFVGAKDVALEVGEVVNILECELLGCSIVLLELNVLVYILNLIELCTPCAVGTDYTIVHKVALVRCIGPIVTCAVFGESIFGEFAILLVVIRND